MEEAEIQAREGNGEMREKAFPSEGEMLERNVGIDEGLLVGLICPHCGEKIHTRADFEYASYRDGMRIVSEITKIFLGLPADRAKLVQEASRVVEASMADRIRARPREVTAAIENELRTDEALARDLCIEALAELVKTRALVAVRDEEGVWIQKPGVEVGS